MKIILIRHGRPTSACNPKLTASGFANWIRRYDAAFVAGDSRPEVIDQTHREFHSLSSDLKRAIHSCEIYTGKKPETSLKLFREMEIPRYKLPLTLRAWTWVYLCRVLWTLGLQGPFESYRQAKVRAQEAAQHLIDTALTHQNVVLFAHGYINLHIRRELKKRDWKIKQKSNQYWGVSQLELAK